MKYRLSRVLATVSLVIAAILFGLIIRKLVRSQAQQPEVFSCALLQEE